jgi:hypothetical protein
MDLSTEYYGRRHKVRIRYHFINAVPKNLDPTKTYSTRVSKVKKEDNSIDIYLEFLKEDDFPTHREFVEKYTCSLTAFDRN